MLIPWRVANVLAFVSVVLILVSCAVADGPTRGLVVDRTDSFLWIGLPNAVPAGTVFDIRLVPNDKVIARAKVLECTPDSPFVAKASFRLTDPKGFIPTGAYAEQSASREVPETDRTDGYNTVRLEPKGINPLSLNVDAFFPTNSSLATETGDIWPAIFLDYRLSNRDRVTTSIEAGYTHKSRRFSVTGAPVRRDFRVIPVTFDAKFWAQSRAVRRGGWFAKLGVGAYAIRDTRTVSGFRTVDDFVTFGWLAGLGYESRGGGLAQLYFVDTSHGGFRGIMAGVGARF